MSNDIKEKYLEKKKVVIECIDKSIDFLKNSGYEHQADIMKSQKNSLENGEFTISVVGEFSAGKSTFLNCLMREKILPSYTNETTATINFLRHKTKADNGESGRVNYQDGSCETFDDLSFDTIKKYVSTDSTVDVAHSVKSLDLFLDSKFLEGNVTLVDTPGLNGIAEGHKELTMEQIEKSSAGIFMFNASQPGSESDFKFLNALCNHVDSIMLVLNRIDCINASEDETPEKVVEKLKENYKKLFPEATTIPKIWPVSAYQALVARSSKNMEYQGRSNYSDDEKEQLEQKSRMQLFEDYLWTYLTQGEKAVQELISPLKQLDGQLKAIKNQNDIELNMLDGKLDQSELQQQQLALEKSILDMNKKLKENSREIKKRVSENDKHFLEAIQSESSRIVARIESEIDNFTNPDDIEPERLEKKLKKSLKEAMDRAYNDYLEEFGDIIYQETGDIVDVCNHGVSENFKIEINEKLDLPTAHIGLAAFDDKKNALEKEIDKLQQEADAAEIDKWKKAEIEDQRDELQRQLKDLQNRRDAFEEMRSSTQPSVQRYTTQEEVETSRTGLFHNARDFIFGKKTKILDVTRVDDREYKEYKAQTASKMLRYDSQIEELQRQIVALPPASKDAELIVQQKNRLLADKRSELERMQEQYSREIKEKMGILLAKQKAEIRDYADELCKECVKEYKNSFKKEEKNRTAAIEDMIDINVRELVEQKKKELEIIISKQESAVEERDKRIEKLTSENQQIVAILLNALDIKESIESEEVAQNETISI